MNITKFLEIIRIVSPVFALLALGNILSRTGKMTEQHRSFLNWLAYYISLPCLIFAGMAVQPIGRLLNAGFIFGNLLAMSAMFAIAVVITLALRLDKKTAVVMIFSTYWANVAYMGFPLTESAFGGRGFLYAAVVNAITMPALVAVTFVMIGLCSDKKQGVLASLRGALVNPIILSSIAGVLFSLAAGALGFGGGGAAPSPLPPAAREALGLCGTILKNVGTMGLSLALLSIGGALRFRSFGRNALPISVAVVCKLAVLPFLTLLVMRLFFPAVAADRDAAGTAALLMAMPSATAAAVVAAKFGLDERLVSSIVAVSLIGSVVTIPLWLYVVL